MRDNLYKFRFKLRRLLGWFRSLGAAYASVHSEEETGQITITNNAGGPCGTEVNILRNATGAACFYFSAYFMRYTR